jgi:hypothetical protein
MLFNPGGIGRFFAGNTGPFIQYTMIPSSKASLLIPHSKVTIDLHPKEKKELIKQNWLLR